MTDAMPSPELRPVRSGLLAGPLDDLAALKLAGSRCRGCGETTLGTNALCPNCGRDDVAPIPLSDEGHVWTYTVIRYRPPGAYKGPEPFVPFAVGLVELPEGLRVVAPIGGDPEAVCIGIAVRFAPRVRDDGVVEFVYNPAA